VGKAPALIWRSNDPNIQDVLNLPLAVREQGIEGSSIPRGSAKGFGPLPDRKIMYVVPPELFLKKKTGRIFAKLLGSEQNGNYSKTCYGKLKTSRRPAAYGKRGRLRMMITTGLSEP